METTASTGESPQYSCPHCDYQTTRKCSLDRHEKTHIGNKAFKCAHCDYSTNSEQYLDVHMMRHAGVGRRFLCDTCGYAAASKSEFKTHNRTHMGEKDKPSDCNQDDFSASQNGSLDHHVQRHNTGASKVWFKCDKCTYRTKARDNLLHHVRQHHPESKLNGVAKKCHSNQSKEHQKNTTEQESADSDNADVSTVTTSRSLRKRTATGRRVSQPHAKHRCQECGYVTLNRSSLTRHLRTHTGERPYKCSLCNYATTQSCHLERHMDWHAGKVKKAFACKTCNYKAYSLSILKEHERIHTGEKPFKCDQCSFTTSYRKCLKTHMSKHTGDTSLLCTQCGYKARSEHALSVHAKKHTNDKPYVCSQCGYRTGSKVVLNKHVATCKTSEMCRKDIQNSSISSTGSSEMQEEHTLHTSSQTVHTEQHQALNGQESNSREELEEDMDTSPGKHCVDKEAIVASHSDLIGSNIEEQTVPLVNEVSVGTNVAKDSLLSPAQSSVRSVSATVAKSLEHSHANSSNHKSKPGEKEARSRLGEDVDGPRKIKLDQEMRLSCRLQTISASQVNQAITAVGNVATGAGQMVIAKECTNVKDAADTSQESVKTEQAACSSGKGVDTKLPQAQDSRSADQTSLGTDHFESSTSQGASSVGSECAGPYQNQDEKSTDRVIENGKPAETFRFQCTACVYKTNHEKAWELHLQVHPSGDTYRCNLCDFCASSDFSLHEHKSRQHSSSMTFSCSLCKYKTKQKAQLEKHMHSHSKEKPFKCDQCDFATVYEQSFKQHVAAHSDEKPFACPECSFRAKYKPQLARHMMSHSDKFGNVDRLLGVKIFLCDECGFCAFNSTSFKRHVRSHTGEKPFKCELCDFATSQKGHLKRHMNWHNGTLKKRHACTICSYRSESRTCLATHMNIHTGEKPFKCHMCDFASAHKRSLEQHLARHKGIKRFTCDTCGFQTAESSQMTLHKRKHLSNKHLRCDQCNYSTVWPSNFKAHVLRHKGIHMNRCHLCSYKAPDKNALLAHREEAHKEKPFKCTYCDFATGYKKSLSIHLMTHTGEKPYACDKCEYRSLLKCSMVEHQRRHMGDKPFACDLCPYKSVKKSALTRHMKKHTGERPYQCDQCGFCASQKETINRHMERHVREKLFQCSTCGLKTGTASKLKKHAEICPNYLQVAVGQSVPLFNPDDVLHPTAAQASSEVGTNHEVIQVSTVQAEEILQTTVLNLSAQTEETIVQPEENIAATDVIQDSNVETTSDRSEELNGVQSRESLKHYNPAFSETVEVTNEITSTSAVTTNEMDSSTGAELTNGIAGSSGGTDVEVTNEITSTEVATTNGSANTDMEPANGGAGTSEGVITTISIPNAIQLTGQSGEIILIEPGVFENGGFLGTSGMQIRVTPEQILQLLERNTLQDGDSLQTSEEPVEKNAETTESQ